MSIEMDDDFKLLIAKHIGPYARGFAENEKVFEEFDTVYKTDPRKALFSAFLTYICMLHDEEKIRFIGLGEEGKNE